MTSRRIFWAAMGALAAVALGSTARADVVIGNFETGVDGWGSVTGPGSPTYASVTAAADAAHSPVTLGTHALKSTTAAGGFWGPNTGNLVAQYGITTMEQATGISYDLTMNAADLFTGSNDASNFAQSNAVSFSLFGTGGSLGSNTVNNFGQKTAAQVSMTDSLNPTKQSQWNGVDGTRHITWSFASFTVTDPTDGVTKTYSQILAAHPDVPWDLQINFVEQIGDNSGAGDPGSFYFDNVVLATPLPEPASLTLIGLAVPALLRRRRV